MTPFIDVTLVLIIIFMVAAPLSTVDVAVDLPPCSRSLALGEVGLEDTGAPSGPAGSSLQP